MDLQKYKYIDKGIDLKDFVNNEFEMKVLTRQFVINNVVNKSYPCINNISTILFISKSKSLARTPFSISSLEFCKSISCVLI